MVEFFQQVVGGIETGSMYALAAMGLVLIYQTAKIINFSQGTLGMFMAYVCTGLILDLGLPMWIAVPVAMILAMVLGALIDRFLMNGKSNITKALHGWGHGAKEPDVPQVIAARGRVRGAVGGVEAG